MNLDLTFAGVNGRPVFCKGANWIPCDSYPSRVPLPVPLLNVQVRNQSDRFGKESVALTVSSDVFAKWVWLEAHGEKREGRFIDNFFDLHPGETWTVTYDAPMPERFEARSLIDLYK